MSVQAAITAIDRMQRELADLQAKLSSASKKEADAHRKMSQIQRGLTGRISLGQLESKTREMGRAQDEISKAQKEQSDLNRRLADKTRDLHKRKADLAKEEERERTKLQLLDRRRREDVNAYNRQLNSELLSQRAVLLKRAPAPVVGESTNTMKKFDLFISHASEDKEGFVAPLVLALQALGLQIWYDDFELKVGDSLRRSIDRGLINSCFGVVVLSSAFFAKNWTQYELDGMVSREMDGVKIILPIWHRLTKDEVMQFSPSLADRVALNSSIKSIQEIAAELAYVAFGTSKSDAL